MNKQIEEMAKDICLLPCPCEECVYPKYRKNYDKCKAKVYAERAYSKGYRKQSEGEWKKRGNEKTCSLCQFIYYSNNDEWTFCPNCGAKMKGDEGK